MQGIKQYESQGTKFEHGLSKEFKHAARTLRKIDNKNSLETKWRSWLADRKNEENINVDVNVNV